MDTHRSSAHLSRSPLLYIALSFAAGILLSNWIDLSVSKWMAAALAAAVLACIISHRAGATALILGAFVFAGAFAYKAERSSISSDRIRILYDNGTLQTGDPVEIEGVVVGSGETAPNGTFVVLDVETLEHLQKRRPVSGRVRLFILAASEDARWDLGRLGIKAGSRLRTFCRLKRDDGFRNPGVLPKTRMLEWQGIDATASIKSPLLIEKLADPSGLVMVSGVYQVREGLIQRFRQLFSPDVSGILIAVILGNDNYLDKQIADAFREGGTFHILVISGMHITFIGGLAALLAGIFVKQRWLHFASVCSFLWIYTIAVGAETPALRACLMFTVFLFSLTIYRKGSMANALGFCGLVLLVLKPSELFTPSFQLTFVSVSALVLAGFPLVSTLRQIGSWKPDQSRPFPAKVPVWLGRLAETLYWDEQKWRIEAARNVWKAELFKRPIPPLNRSRNLRKAASFLFEGLIISAIVQIAMLPLTVHYFHRVTPVGILLNLWTGFFVALSSFISLIAVGIAYVSGELAAPLVALTELAHRLMMSFPAQRSDLGWLSFRVPVYSGAESWLYLGYFAAIGFICLAVFRWNPFQRSGPFVGRVFGTRNVSVIGLAAALLMGVIVLHPFGSPRPDGRLRVVFLDVDQGDSTFITFPNGETMLVDGGGRVKFRNEDDQHLEPDIPSIGESVVSEFLWERGYSKIDHLVASHAHADHIQGLTDAANNFSIGRAWFGMFPVQDEETMRYMNGLAAHQVEMVTAARPQKYEIGGTVIEILHPPLLGIDHWPENDRSLVMRITHGSRTFLLTGDIEELAERQIVGLDSDLSADVVKVPHHGSRTSSCQALVDRIRPQFAVISVGRDSRFGHPHQEVVERWRTAGAKVVTTGDRGTIGFSTNGTDLEVSFFVPE